MKGINKFGTGLRRNAHSSLNFNTFSYSNVVLFVVCKVNTDMGSHSVTWVTFPLLPQLKLVLNLATLEGCKAELTQVVVTSQDSLPAKYGHLSQK